MSNASGEKTAKEETPKEVIKTVFGPSWKFGSCINMTVRAGEKLNDRSQAKLKVPTPASRPMKIETKKANNEARSKEYLETIDFEKYMSEMVTPILEKAMCTVAKVRPKDPIGFIAEFLLENKDK